MQRHPSAVTTDQAQWWSRSSTQWPHWTQWKARAGRVASQRSQYVPPAAEEEEAAAGGRQKPRCERTRYLATQVTARWVLFPTALPQSA